METNELLEATERTLHWDNSPDIQKHLKILSKILYRASSLQITIPQMQLHHYVTTQRICQPEVFNTSPYLLVSGM